MTTMKLLLLMVYTSGISLDVCTYNKKNSQFFSINIPSNKLANVIHRDRHKDDLKMDKNLIC